MKRIFILICLILSIFATAHAVNDTSGQTWVLDTAGSIWTTPIDIVWIIWTDINADDDDLVINETNGGKRVVALKGKAGIDMIVPFPGNSGHLPSFYLQTIDSGGVQVRTGIAR
jgi:hypothetical protein